MRQEILVDKSIGSIKSIMIRIIILSLNNFGFGKLYSTLIRSAAIEPLCGTEIFVVHVY